MPARINFNSIACFQISSGVSRRIPHKSTQIKPLKCRTYSVVRGNNSRTLPSQPCYYSPLKDVLGIPLSGIRPANSSFIHLFIEKTYQIAVLPLATECLSQIIGGAVTRSIGIRWNSNPGRVTSINQPYLDDLCCQSDSEDMYIPALPSKKSGLI